MYWLLEKQGKLYFLQSSQTKGRGETNFQLFRRVVFPSPLDPHPFLAATRGVPLDPLCRALRHRALLLWHRALGAKASHPDQRFCRLCNFDLPNKQRFSLQRHKSCKKLHFLEAVCLVTQSFGFRAKGSGQPGKNSVSLFVFVLSRYLCRVGSGGKL